MRLANLTIPARPEFVSLARLVISSVASDHYDVTDDQLDNLKLALSEAVVLAIRTSSASETVSVIFDGTDTKMSVRVESLSAVFEDDSRDDHVGEANSAFGLPLIHSLLDDVIIETSDRGESLTLVMACGRALDL